MRFHHVMVFTVLFARDDKGAPAPKEKIRNWGDIEHDKERSHTRHKDRGNRDHGRDKGRDNRLGSEKDERKSDRDSGKTGGRDGHADHYGKGGGPRGSRERNRDDRQGRGKQSHSDHAKENEASSKSDDKTEEPPPPPETHWSQPAAYPSLRGNQKPQRSEWSAPPPISQQQFKQNLSQRSNYTSLKRSHSTLSNSSHTSDQKIDSPKETPPRSFDDKVFDEKQEKALEKVFAKLLSC